MTKINRLLLRGFKSFAFKTELVFGDRFNCVLGPNGSGKSNILDALCFVLGKGSTKGMRAEKSANLIYNGGKSKNPAKEGEVSIYFDNAKKTFPTEDPEVKISRIVKQSGQSVYKINDKNRTRQQILDLLSVARINPDGYNIILQGDIIRFVEMHSQERRKILEEIAGISVYEDKKNKTMRELEKVEAKLSEADIILTERNTHLKELKKERDQALKYKNLEGKRDQNKASLLSIQIKSKESEKAKTEGKLRKGDSKAARIQKEIDSLKQQVTGKKKQMDDLNSQIEEKGEKEQVKLHKEVEQLKVDIATNKTRIGFNEQELVKVAGRKNQLQKNLLDLSEKVTSLKDDIKGIEKQKSQNLREIKQVEARIAQFKKDHKVDAAGEIEKDIEKLDKEADDKQKEIQDLREKQQELLREKDRLEFQINSIDEKMDKVLEVEKEHKSEIQSLKQKKSRLKEISLGLSKSLNEDSGIGAQISVQREKIDAAREDLSRLRAKDVGIKEKVAGNIAVQKILENRSKFGGVYDSLSNIGQVRSEYALALEVAAGHRIKSIAVDNDSVAAKCIKYLKANKLGTAAFLPLNKMKARPVSPSVKKLAGAKGAKGLAIDLISFQPKFRKAFEYVFGHTLVVDSIDVARRIGVGSARMVTLDGDLLEVSGVMYGGYRQKKKGSGFQEKELAGDIQKKESEFRELEKKLTVFENKRKELTSSIDSFRKEKAELEGDIIKIEKGLHLDSEDMDASRKVKEEFRKNFKKTDKELDDIQADVSSLNKGLAGLKIKKQQLRSQMSDIRSPTLVAELNTFDQKRTELKDEANKMDAEIKSMQSQIETIILPEKENTEKILKQHDREEEKFREEKAGLEEKIKEQGKELEEKEKKQSEFSSRFKGALSKRNKLNDEINKIEGNTIRKEEEIRSAEQRSRDFSIDMARLKAELAALYEEFKPYKDVKTVSRPAEDIRKELNQLERMVSDMGSVNLKSLEIYESVEKEYNVLLKKKENLNLEKEDVLKMIEEIDSKKKDTFMKTFNVLNENFKKIFTTLTPKGEASLVIENPEDIFEEGVRIMVRLAGKKFLDIRSLSGGEKTLTALAFIFSIQEHEPASFYVLDEVDAALDKRNSEKFARLIRKYADRAQYMLISHNDGVITEADNLYGISMNENGMSKIVSLKI